jgi:hypothetical protein
VAPLGVDRQRAQLQARAQQPVPVRQAFRHRLVFGGAVEQQIAAGLAARTAFAHRAQGRQHRGLDAFGGAAVEHDPARRRTDHAARGRPRRFAQRPCAQAGSMAAARVAEALPHRFGGGADGGREDGRRCIGVKVDFNVHE